MASIPRVDVLGVGISVIDMPRAIAEVERFIAEDRREYVCVTGVHGVMESQRDLQLREIHNESGLTTPDGMPMVWAGRWAGAKSIQRVYGPDLMLALCHDGVGRNRKHFFYGGGDGVTVDLKRRLSEAIPGLQVVGAHTPPFRLLTEVEVTRVADMINGTEPDIVWVGLSTPKQERWMSAMRPLLKAPVLIGVGAAFDVHSGRSLRAPKWMQLAGMEWLYRLMKEPRRLWRRYLRNNPAFLCRIAVTPPRLRADDELALFE